MEIREGTPADAPFLADVVIEAIGPELCLGLAESTERIPLVKELFTSLSSLPDSQYSYRNSLVAVDGDGTPVGGIIAYDGGRLRELRKAFVREANRILGWRVTEEESEDWGDEAAPDEIYIDSLYVVPEARKRGVATALVRAVGTRFAGSGKPLGLLVEPENEVARITYQRWGFREVGISNFFYTPMLHMQL